MKLAMNSTVTSGTPRMASMKTDEISLTAGILGAAAERQEDAERQRHHDADIGDDQRHQEAAPQRVST